VKARGRRRRRSTGGRFLWLAGATVVFMAVPAASSEEPLEAADRLVRGIYYEGLPYEEARNLSLEQAGYLAMLLDDPSRRRDHENVALALGIAGHAGSFDILEAHPAGASGELSRETWRLVRTRYRAMGHLARFDPRAEVWLTARARGAGSEPEISFRAFRGERMRRELRLHAIRALGLAGTRSARATLVEMARDSDGSISGAAREALVRFDRIRQVGTDGFFREAGEGRRTRGPSG